MDNHQRGTNKVNRMQINIINTITKDTIKVMIRTKINMTIITNFTIKIIEQALISTEIMVVHNMEILRIEKKCMRK